MPEFVPVPFLMYHRMGPRKAGTIVPGHYVKAQQFANHLWLLKLMGYRSSSLEDIQNKFQSGDASTTKRVAITFDDGYTSFSEIALPVLEKSGFTATVFLVSDLVGANNAWDFLVGDVNETLMSREQVLAARAKGIEFGSHTKTHANLAQVDPEVGLEEVQGSKHSIESWLGHEVRYFSYPYGGENSAVRDAVRQAGYSGAVTTERGANGPSTDPFGWGRINVRSSTGTFKLMRKLLATRNVL